MFIYFLCVIVCLYRSSVVITCGTVMCAERRKMLYFEVKFYPKDPTADLRYEQTRFAVTFQYDLLYAVS